MCSTQSMPGKEMEEKMYSTGDKFKGKRNMSEPKKENMFHSVFNVLNLVWEQFSKVPASFIASINYPLSVTVVDNQGLITPDFFKNVTEKKEPLARNNVYICNPKVKESLGIVEDIRGEVYNTKKSTMCKIANEGIEDLLEFNLAYKDMKKKDLSPGKEQWKNHSANHIPNCNYLSSTYDVNNDDNTELFEHIYLDTNAKKIYDGKDSYTLENLGDTVVNKNKSSYSFTNHTENNIMDSKISTGNEWLNQQSLAPNSLTNMTQKIFGGVTDKLRRIDSVDSEVTMKHSYSPRQRRRRNTVAMGRGRGRARSQLRRSGVSQTRHRKERTKHDIVVDIENDLKTWKDNEMYCSKENEEPSNCFALDEGAIDSLDDDQYSLVTLNPTMYTIADVKPKFQKPKGYRTVEKGVCKYSTKMRSIPEYQEETCTFDVDWDPNRCSLQNSRLRPRLMSESSIDSEDSYCIVFETGSEVTIKSDFEDDGSDIDESTDDEETYLEEEVPSPACKVKFNLNPVVHVMVQWDYAYRAARKGPWEEMARDRERFKGRINCIARVLNPILTVQHRAHIWQERFAVAE